MMSCHHMTGLSPVPPRTPEGCEECLLIGSPWVHLRLCLGCGHVAFFVNYPEKLLRESCVAEVQADAGPYR